MLLQLIMYFLYYLTLSKSIVFCFRFHIPLKFSCSFHPSHCYYSYYYHCFHYALLIFLIYVYFCIMRIPVPLYHCPCTFIFICHYHPLAVSSPPHHYYCYYHSHYELLNYFFFTLIFALLFQYHYYYYSIAMLTLWMTITLLNLIIRFYNASIFVSWVYLCLNYWCYTCTVILY